MMELMRGALFASFLLSSTGVTACRNTVVDLSDGGTSPPPATSPGPTASPSPVPTDLLGHWKFDESSGTTALDSSGNGRTATLNGGSFTPGQINNALALDGIDDDVHVEPFDLGNVMTFSIWADINGGATEIQTLVSNKPIAGSAEEGFHFFVNSFTTSDGKLHFETGNGLNGAAIRSMNSVVAYPGWHHLAAVIDRSAGTGVLYLDGVQVQATGSIRTDFPNNMALYIGRTGNGWVMEGRIDDLRIYNRALSASEVGAL